MILLSAVLFCAASPSSFWQEFDAGFANAFKAYKPGQDVKVAMSGPAEITHGGYGAWTFTFTAGSGGLGAGQAVGIATRHVSGWGTPQDYDPGAPNYVTASSSARIALKLHPEQYFSIFNPYFYDYFPWQHITWVEVTRGRLQEGESIQLVFGDRSHGSPGFRAPAVARRHALFLAMVRQQAGGQFISIPTRLSVTILPGAVSRLNIILPTDTTPGAPNRVILRAEDSQGNLAAGYRGTVALDTLGGGSTLPYAYTFKASDRGIHTFSNVRFSTPGIYRVEASDSSSASLHAMSNPSRCVAARAGRLKVFWGGLHDHSIISDGTGSPSHAFQYARDVAGLDFFALTDHGFEMDNTRWQLDQHIATQFNDPPYFVTFYGYEWSGQTDVGGDHNVIYEQPGLPLYRSNSYYDVKDPFEYSGPNLDAPHIVQLYKRLHRLMRGTTVRVLVVPHWRGRIANPLWNDPELSPVIELASEAGWHEDWVLGFLERGYRLGFVGGSDDHYGRPGYGMPDHYWYGYASPPAKLSSSAGRFRIERFGYPWGHDVQGSPLTAVLAYKSDRASIFDALFKRRCYVTSGPRDILTFTANGHSMGAEFTAQNSVDFEATTETISPVTALILKKDGGAICTVRPEQTARSMHLSYTDSKDFKGHFYYIEVLTTNPQERVASSPIWIK